MACPGAGAGWGLGGLCPKRWRGGMAWVAGAWLWCWLGAAWFWVVGESPGLLFIVGGGTPCNTLALGPKDFHSGTAPGRRLASI